MASAPVPAPKCVNVPTHVSTITPSRPPPRRRRAGWRNVVFDEMDGRLTSAGQAEPQLVRPKIVHGAAAVARAPPPRATGTARDSGRSAARAGAAPANDLP